MPKFKNYAVSILIALGVGALASALTMGSMDLYETAVTPALSPPAIVFPIVWTVLYILMGISAALIYASVDPDRWTSLTVYALQLAVNFVWPLLFFGAQKYFAAFVCLVILFLLVVIMILRFYKINKTAAYLQIPYVLWLLFAGYLNVGVWLLNRGY